MGTNVAEGRLQVLQIYRLLQSVRKVDLEHIKKMVKLGVDGLINLTEPKEGMGVLHMAVSAYNHELVGFLLAQGADPNVQDKLGRTPAMLAAELGNDTIMGLLLQSQANMLLQDVEGKGVLFYCIHPTQRHIRCLQMALNCHADPNNVSIHSIPVFQLMCEKADECTPMCLDTLEAGADPNATNLFSGITALMGAARTGSLPLVKAILKSGGKPNTIDLRRFTAAQYAAMGGSLEVIQVLSAYSADMSIINTDSCTALHYAAATGNATSCKFLAQRGCNPKQKNQEGVLPRLIAKNAGNKAAAKELRKAERQQGKSRAGERVAHLWALTLHDWSYEFEADLRKAFGEKSDTVSAEVFISVLEDFNAPASMEELLFVLSAHDKRKEGFVNVNDFFKGVKYIKKPYLISSFIPKKKKEKKGKGAKKKGKFVLPLPICTQPQELQVRRSDGGPPPFMIERYYNRSDIRRFDSDHPPEHPIINDSHWYIEKPVRKYVSVNYSVKEGDLESLDLAFSGGVSVDVHDQFYKTPLMVAASSGNYEVTQYLLSKGANVNACDQFSWTPLHHAAHAGQLEIMELLVGAGATIDTPALSGGTPLMRAIESSQAACVDFLIKAGANVLAETKNEQTCLDIAKAFSDPRIIDMVQAKVDSLPKPKDKGRGKGKGKGKGGKGQRPKSSKKNVAAERSETLSSPTGPTPLHKDSNSITLQNTKITTGLTTAVDITFVPKTVWGKPPTTSQLMAMIEKKKEPLSLELDLDDFLVPFNHHLSKKKL